MPRKVRSEACPVDMTPMIDVVFQLIIFFIVTIKMEESINLDIELEDARHGPIIEEQPRTFIIEVDEKGWISIHGAQLGKRKLYEIMRSRFNRYGEFPVLIRGDKRARHEDIRSVMDICTSANIWRINFVAIKERKTKT